MIDNLIDQKIVATINEHILDLDLNTLLPPCDYASLISFAELIDRLTIVNLKLYTLKDLVVNTIDTEFKAKAASIDIYLVEERSKIKNCINKKLKDIVTETKESVEIKNYGNTEADYD